MASYDIIPTERGFQVIPRKYDYIPPFEANIDEYGFWRVKQKGNIFGGEDWFGSSDEVPAYAFRKLEDVVVSEIYFDWKSPKNPNGYVHKNVKKWAKNETGKSLNGRIHAEWLRCLSLLDDQTKEVHKKLFSLSCGGGYWGRLKDVLKKKDAYVLEDLKNHRAIRIALLYGGWEGTENWISVFSQNGSYRSLNKTLFNLPCNVPNYELPVLRNTKMNQAITTRLKLMFYLEILSKNDPIWFPDDTQKREKMLKILERSSEEDCKKAVAFMWNYFPSPQSNDFRSTKDIKRVMNLIVDRAPSNDKISLMSWTKESELYHHDLELQRRVQQQEAEERAQRHKVESERIKKSLTAVPPIPLPENPNIKLLDTYQSVVEEGNTMGHCIASYAETAVRGGCYLFHVDHNGEPASVEVSPEGYVRQSYGKRDVINEASEYAKKELAKWAKGLNGKKPIVKYAPLPGNSKTELVLDDGLGF